MILKFNLQWRAACLIVAAAAGTSLADTTTSSAGPYATSASVSTTQNGRCDQSVADSSPVAYSYSVNWQCMDAYCTGGWPLIGYRNANGGSGSGTGSGICVALYGGTTTAPATDPNTNTAFPPFVTTNYLNYTTVQAVVQSAKKSCQAVNGGFSIGPITFPPNTTVYVCGAAPDTSTQVTTTLGSCGDPAVTCSKACPANQVAVSPDGSPWGNGCACPFFCNPINQSDPQTYCAWL